MRTREMLTTLDGEVLAEAFPSATRLDAVTAGVSVAHDLNIRQWTERFAAQVAGETAFIPYRLHLARDSSDLPARSSAWFMMQCLKTRSNDGFERQLAARNVLSGIQPWSAPFVIALIGEYVMEILQDIDAALSPEICVTLKDFIHANPDYWQVTKQRVGSYWNVYYRRSHARSDYVGFKLIARLELQNSELVN